MSQTTKATNASEEMRKSLPNPQLKQRPEVGGDPSARKESTPVINLGITGSPSTLRNDSLAANVQTAPSNPSSTAAPSGTTLTPLQRSRRDIFFSKGLHQIKGIYGDWLDMVEEASLDSDEDGAA